MKVVIVGFAFVLGGLAIGAHLAETGHWVFALIVIIFSATVSIKSKQ